MKPEVLLGNIKIANFFHHTVQAENMNFNPYIFTFYIINQRGSFMVWEINMGVCPRLEFDNIMFINCLGYDFYIYGAFEFLCNSNANL